MGTGEVPILVNRYLAITSFSSGFGANVCSGLSHFSWATTGVAANATKRNRITFIALRRNWCLPPGIFQDQHVGPIGSVGRGGSVDAMVLSGCRICSNLTNERI